MKAGDKVRPKPDATAYDPTRERVIKYVGTHHVVYGVMDMKEQVQVRAAFEATFEVIPDFFEVGKTYKRDGDTFRVTAVETHGTGEAVAFGEITYRAGGARWVTLLRYGGWTEA